MCVPLCVCVCVYIAHIYVDVDVCALAFCVHVFVCFYVQQGAIVEMVKSVFYGNRSNCVLYYRYSVCVRFDYILYRPCAQRVRKYMLLLHCVYTVKYILSRLVDTLPLSCVSHLSVSVWSVCECERATDLAHARAQKESHMKMSAIARIHRDTHRQWVVLPVRYSFPFCFAVGLKRIEKRISFPIWTVLCRAVC